MLSTGGTGLTFYWAVDYARRQMTKTNKQHVQIPWSNQLVYERT
mgnify:CR=1 FL=1